MNITLNYTELETMHETREAFISGEINRKALDEYRTALSFNL